MQSYHEGRLKHQSVFLNSRQRRLVLEAIIEHSKVKNWKLWAVHVQNNHVHAIISASQTADTVMVQLKAWATRKLREAGFNMQKVWTKHGSTRYLNRLESLQQKIEYVIYGQGKFAEYYIGEKI